VTKAIVEISGLKEVQENLNKATRQIENNTVAGVRAASLFLKGESMELTPVDSGLLRNSSFAVTEKTPSGPVAEVGFAAEYAPFVHEAEMKLQGQPRSSGRGKYWDSGENKFLQKAVARNLTKIINIIARFAGKSNGSK